jgi:hypothetical protein
MKKIIVLSWVIVMLIVSGCTGRKGNNVSDSTSLTNSKSTSEITFREYQHDFGKVTEGEKLSFIFTFDNKGTGDLIINSASTSCGCTVPKYDTKPIHSGESGKLEVVFDTSGRNGMQTKVITVKSNASTPVVLLKITAEIESNNK